MPYIIGVHDNMMAKVTKMDLDDAIIVNVDDGSITDAHHDRSLLPADSVSAV